MKFVWDPDKEKANKKKHGVNFLDACYVFADKFMLTLYDNEHSGEEDRWVTIGQTPSNMLVVVHTFQEIKGRSIYQRERRTRRSSTWTEGANNHEKRI